jgi:hypothetical protein
MSGATESVVQSLFEPPVNDAPSYMTPRCVAPIATTLAPCRVDGLLQGTVNRLADVPVSDVCSRCWDALWVTATRN